MIYFWKIWTIPLILISLTTLICKKVVIPITSNLVPIGQNLKEFGFYFINVRTLERYKTVLDAKATIIASDCLLIISILLALLMIWFLVDLLSGQLKNDFMGKRAMIAMVRNVSQDNIQLNVKEEAKADFWIKKGRMAKWRKKLRLIIPASGNNSVAKIVETRCDEFLLSWLNQNFSKKNWLPIEVKRTVLMTFIIIKEK